MKIHNLGFPRIGSHRELKKGLESFWKGSLSAEDLLQQARNIRSANWKQQAFLDLVPVADFSLYDQMLDMSFTLGNVPPRALQTEGSLLDQYFRVARGQSVNDAEKNRIRAGEMTKWFDTNYHYIVPEFTAGTSFTLNPERILEQLEEARSAGICAKPVLIGPVTYLRLGKEKDASSKYDLLETLLPVYRELFDLLSAQGVEWVQIDEPILATDLDESCRQLLKTTYAEFSKSGLNLLLTSYFGGLQDNLELALELPTAGLHVDAVRGAQEIETILKRLPADKTLSLGLIDGRNIWKTDLNAALDTLEPIAQTLGDRLWLAPSCSLLHVPVDLDLETEMDPEIKSWLAFAIQKLEELKILARAVNHGREAAAGALNDNRQAVEDRRNSPRVNNPKIQEQLLSVTPAMGERTSDYATRARIQKTRLNLPTYPTTTIGSFPQTHAIRSARRKFKNGELSRAAYDRTMRKEIKQMLETQEDLDLDVLVHGEPERNDMVEYFGEQLHGYEFSNFGWVQSYGSRCVKPPILYGDISRPAPMTVHSIQYAQSLTSKPVKGMLTGPVTLLNWSFVRNDQPRSTTCLQLALAVREEVQDLEKAGIKIIQIDEAALREGLPLKKEQWPDYLNWTISAYKIAANGVNDATQIHTHMCYSEFNDIIQSIADMDADVITIETSRSDMELLNVFDEFDYPNQIGPGVYDIHSPNVPTVHSIVDLMQKAALRIPADRLWINPDCGLKTRGWPETIASLKNMTEAAKILRAR